MLCIRYLLKGMPNQDSAFPIEREESRTEARSILAVAEALKKYPLWKILLYYRFSKAFQALHTL